MAELEAPVAENVENNIPVEQEATQVPESTTPVESTPQQVKESWETDKRWGKIFKSHDDTYKSYREMEKMINPLKEKLNGYENTFKEYELDFSKFGDYVKEYRELRDPNGMFQQRANYIGRWLDNPKYAPQVEAYFQDLENKELQEMFPNMTREQIERQMAIEAELNSFKQERQAQETERQVSSFVGVINDGYSKIENLAKSYGVNLETLKDPKIEGSFREYFLTKCEKEGVDPKYVYAEFRHQFEEALNDAYSKKTEADVLARLEKNKKAGVVPKSSGTPTVSNQKGSTKDRLAQAMYGKKYDDL